MQTHTAPETRTQTRHGIERSCVLICTQRGESSGSGLCVFGVALDSVSCRTPDSSVAEPCQRSPNCPCSFSHNLLTGLGVIGTICLQKPVRNQMLMDFVLLHQPLKSPASFSCLFLKLWAGTPRSSGKKTYRQLPWYRPAKSDYASSSEWSGSRN